MPEIETLTIVSDGNPFMDDAVSYLDKCIEEGKVVKYTAGSASMGMEGLTVFVTPEFRPEVVQGLKALKYMIIEGE